MKACIVLQGCLWARLKDVSNRITSIVRLLYRFGPSLTTGVVEVGFTTQRTIMTDRRQPCEQRSSCDCEGNMSAIKCVAVDIYSWRHRRTRLRQLPGWRAPGGLQSVPYCDVTLLCVCCVTPVACQVQLKCRTF